MNINIYTCKYFHNQGFRLIFPTGRTFATNFLSWSHFFLIQYLINKCMLINFL